MVHSFDTEIAEKVGINAAIIYGNIHYWCAENARKGTNEFEGLYWTFQSISDFTEKFSYLSEWQIREALRILEKEGYIRTGSFNQSKFDRTKWYADTAFGRKSRIDTEETATSRLQKPQIDTEETAVLIPEKPIEEPEETDTGAVVYHRPIPNISHKYKPQIKAIERTKARKTSGGTFDKILDSFQVIKDNPELRETFVDFIRMRKTIKAPLTDRALKLNINEAVKLSENDPVKMQAIVEQSIKNSWKGFYALKTDGPKKKPPASPGNQFRDLLRKEGYE